MAPAPISISSKRPAGAPSFTTNLRFDRESIACSGFERCDADSGLMCEFGGHVWMAPLVLVVAPADARRCRTRWKEGRVVVGPLMVLQPRPRVRDPDPSCRVLAVAFGTCPLADATIAASTAAATATATATAAGHVEQHPREDDVRMEFSDDEDLL